MTVRWGMLAVISLGITALTLNWFDVATAFPLIGAEFKVGLGSLSYLISLYIVGYGLSHIPGGMLSTAIGMKKTLVLGLLVQGLAGIMSGLSHSYTELACYRVASGIGGSVFIAVGTAAVVVWFREKDVTLELGITGGAVFSAGAACALYVWLYVQRAAGWHTSLILAGVFELLVMVVTMVTFRLPEGGQSLGGARFDRAATGLMLTLAAVGGFFVPIIFGHLVPRTSFDVGWVFLAIVSFAFALIGLAGRNPVTTLPQGAAMSATALMRPRIGGGG